MVSRIAAVAFGLSAGVVMILFLALDWNEAASLLGFDRPDLTAALADPTSRFAWASTLAVGTFAIAALLAALVGGLAETLLADRRLGALRHDLSLSGRWNAADWRAAFAHTSVADRAEAVIAALVPAANADEGDRRVVVDSVLFANLSEIWLDRVALTGLMGPLAPLLLGIGVISALLRHASGEVGWEIALAAGVSGWFVVRLALYLVRVLLAPAVECAVRTATAAVRPLTSTLALDFVVQRLTQDAPSPQFFETAVRIAPAEAGQVFARLETTMSEFLWRTSEAADRLSAAGTALSDQIATQLSATADRAGEAGAIAATAALAGVADSIRGAVQQREQAIESALAEVRAGIERLLESPAAGTEAGSEAIADALRSALAEQSGILRQASDDLRMAMERIAGSLRTSEQPPSGPAGGTAPNSAVAAGLKNLLREFGES